MRVLVVADIYMIHTYNFIRETLLKLNVDEIVIWGIGSKVEAKDSFDLFYKDNDINIIQGVLDSQDKFDDLLKGLEKVKEFGWFDVCHLHFLGYSAVTIGLLVKDICGKIISNYWGSDWLRANDTQKQYQKYVLELSDYIVADSLQICRQLNEYYDEAFKEKIQYIRFQLPVVREMRSAKINDNVKRSFLNRCGIPSDKIIVTCGYNASEAHNHKDIIKAINNLSREDKDKLFVILPMTYNRDNQEYVNQIKQNLKAGAIDGTVIEDYMDFKDVALLRIVTNIFINMELTDAYSSTMIEYAYCNKITIIGSWLDYSELEKSGAYFEKVDGIDDLTRVLKESLDSFDDVQKKYLGNNMASIKFQENTAGNGLWSDIYYARPSKSKQMPLFESIVQRIERWIGQNNHVTVGIYGASILGGIAYQKIVNVISKENISVFDKHLYNVSWYPEEILKPEALEEKQMSVVITTPCSYMDEIKDEYRSKISSHIITYVQWLKELENSM